MTDLADMVAAWAEWADDVVSAWPDDPAAAEPERQVFEALASRAVEAAPLPPSNP